jgi:hypothetical protein
MTRLRRSWRLRTLTRRIYTLSILSLSVIEVEVEVVEVLLEVLWRSPAMLALDEVVEMLDDVARHVEADSPLNSTSASSRASVLSAATLDTLRPTAHGDRKTPKGSLWTSAGE